ncbi:hypothetical protein [Mucilaginibacter sp. dw_454]|uniref:hypothetical protein n=1 Tax=Mucilaginibacter sp. dw_454 TaxID=2720079 RepID=UPI001BD301F5|nr:hypothetical protein [Mucilaginibacter sp. dw_454]
MESVDTFELKPIGKRSSTWGLLILFNTIALLMWLLLKQVKDADNAIIYAYLLLSNAVIVLSIKNAVRVMLTKDDGIFTYEYLNFFGQLKTMTVQIKTAEYAYEKFAKRNFTSTMRLMIYNDYFNNRVTLIADEKTGFNREQLDVLDEEIKKMREKTA